MLSSIQASQLGFLALDQFNTPNWVSSFTSPQLAKIKNYTANAFSKMGSVFKDYSYQSNDINLKAIATISCISLLALIFISMFRYRNSRNNPALAAPLPLNAAAAQPNGVALQV